MPGSILPIELHTGNGIIVQKRGFLAMEKGLDVSLYFQKRLGKGFFGGEGLFHTVIAGPGKVYLQSMPISNIAERLIPYLPTSSSGDGINISFGDK